MGFWIARISIISSTKLNVYFMLNSIQLRWRKTMQLLVRCGRNKSLTCFGNQKVSALHNGNSCKDISWYHRFEKIVFFPMVFWVRKLVETIQLFFHCCHHTSEENTAFEMIFLSRETSKRQEFGKKNLMQQMKYKTKYLPHFSM